MPTEGKSPAPVSFGSRYHERNRITRMRSPESVPALIFVASSNCDFMPEWEQLHKDIVTEKEHSEVIKLQGEHYLHFDNLQHITDAVFAWIPADAQTAPAAAE